MDPWPPWLTKESRLATEYSVHSLVRFYKKGWVVLSLYRHVYNSITAGWGRQGSDGKVLCTQYKCTEYSVHISTFPSHGIIVQTEPRFTIQYSVQRIAIGSTVLRHQIGEDWMGSSVEGCEVQKVSPLSICVGYVYVCTE